MTTPATITTLDLCGKFVMNKSLSDSTDKMLELQGVSWLTRRAIALATITLNINHYRDDEGVEHIDIDQVLTGGIPGTTEKRTLNWTLRDHQDHLFGAVLAKSRRSKLEAIEEPFLKKDWLPDTIEHGVIEAYAESDTPKSNMTWNVSQVWGFEEIQGNRKYARHLKFMGPKAEDIELRLVYDYAGPV